MTGFIQLDSEGLTAGADLALKPGECVIYNMIDGKPAVLARKVDGGDWKLEGEIVELGTGTVNEVGQLWLDGEFMGFHNNLNPGKWKITATMVD